MKKITVAITGILAAVLLCSPAALAMSVTGPFGQQYGGWFKDSLTAKISHKCFLNGQNVVFTYTSTDQGMHNYAFYADTSDNPYVSIDGGPDMPVDTSCMGTAMMMPPSTAPVYQFAASIDSQSPYANITNPNGPVTTSSGSYPISGIAGDPEGNLTEVQIFDNGAAVADAAISGTNTFSANVPLTPGGNNISAVAYDVVGHSSTSNPVYITCQTGGGGTSGGGTSGGGPTSSSGSLPAPAAAPAKSTSASSNSSSPQIIKFGAQQVLSITDPYAGDTSSNATDVQATAALAGATGKTYDALILLIIILFSLCIFIIYRFRPIFTELDRDKSGLRRRIIIIVTLPSLLPLIGMGFLGYQQLSNSVKNSLSSQLEKAAQTSSLKLDREFSIRRTIIIKTSSDILQIKAQYANQQQQLTQQENACQTEVKADIPAGQYSKVTSNDNCLPFLTGFAQLASSSSAKVGDYLGALSEGAQQASSNLTAQENQRVNELLGSIRDYFPDVQEMEIVDAGKNPVEQASLPPSSSSLPTISKGASDLLPYASKSSLGLLDSTDKGQVLFLTYPVISGKTTLGGAIVAINTRSQGFIPTIWQSTPKPYNSDQVFFITTSGQTVMPFITDSSLTPELKSLASTAPGKIFNLNYSGQKLAARTADVSNTNWVVAVGAPASTILAPLAGIQRTAILAIFGFILLSLLLGIWFVSSIAGEIERLFKGALAYARGDLEYRISLESHDELQVLGDTMNNMAHDIKTAQEALVEKDKEFINIATHELKAPMTSIIGNLSMITDDGMGQVDDTARELIDKAYKGTIRLRDIVTDMLDIARLESGHAEFKLEPIDINALTSSIIEMQTAPAQQASVALNYDNIPMPKVLADKNKLQIIITNFISNAIKYNRPGGTVTISHKVEGNGSLTTSVADTGLGIPEDQQQHIFEKFYRVKHEDRANVPGTGLGMHITKRFIESMNGKVWFTSIHGQGTTFYFTLPLDSSPVPAPVAETPEALPPTISPHPEIIPGS